MGKGDCLKYYHFKIPMSLSPKIDTIHIGDTFCLKSVIQKMLLDTMSNKEIDVSGFDFSIINDIGRHVSTGYISAEKEFDIINKVGKYEVIPITDNVLRTLILYDQVGIDRVFESCLIPKQTGLYEIAFHHLDYSERTVVDANCTEFIEIDIEMNEGAENNYDLLMSSPQPIATKEVLKGGEVIRLS